MAEADAALLVKLSICCFRTQNTPKIAPEGMYNIYGDAKRDEFKGINSKSTIVSFMR